ncbi:hypothetical protein HDV05_004836 [Chytridiales sp. JEL 0842]|nr:hypothetical protein HDV05_004836 [Chytridiales sp. JEL 0842]
MSRRASSSRLATSTGSSEPWACPACTLFNAHDAFQCHMCGTMKPSRFGRVARAPNSIFYEAQVFGTRASASTLGAYAGYTERELDELEEQGVIEIVSSGKRKRKDSTGAASKASSREGTQGLADIAEESLSSLPAGAKMLDEGDGGEKNDEGAIRRTTNDDDDIVMDNPETEQADDLDYEESRRRRKRTRRATKHFSSNAYKSVEQDSQDPFAFPTEEQETNEPEPPGPPSRRIRSTTSANSLSSEKRIVRQDRHQTSSHNVEPSTETLIEVEVKEDTDTQNDVGPAESSEFTRKHARRHLKVAETELAALGKLKEAVEAFRRSDPTSLLSRSSGKSPVRKATSVDTPSKSTTSQVVVDDANDTELSSESQEENTTSPTEPVHNPADDNEGPITDPPASSTHTSPQHSRTTAIEVDDDSMQLPRLRTPPRKKQTRQRSMNDFVVSLKRSEVAAAISANDEEATAEPEVAECEDVIETTVNILKGVETGADVSQSDAGEVMEDIVMDTLNADDSETMEDVVVDSENGEANTMKDFVVETSKATESNTFDPPVEPAEESAQTIESDVVAEISVNFEPAPTADAEALVEESEALAMDDVKADEDATVDVEDTFAQEAVTFEPPHEPTTIQESVAFFDEAHVTSLQETVLQDTFSQEIEAPADPLPTAEPFTDLSKLIPCDDEIIAKAAEPPLEYTDPSSEHIEPETVDQTCDRSSSSSSNYENASLINDMDYQLPPPRSIAHIGPPADDYYVYVSPEKREMFAATGKNDGKMEEVISVERGGVKVTMKFRVPPPLSKVV